MTAAQLLGVLVFAIGLLLAAHLGDSFINWRKRRHP